MTKQPTWRDWLRRGLCMLNAFALCMMIAFILMGATQ